MNITELFNYKISSLKLSLKVLEVEELDKIYQVTLVGGNNGYSDWPRYLNDLSRLMYSIDDCWLIDIKNDVPDDIHYIKIGMKKPFENTSVKTIPVIEVKATFAERYFEKNDKIRFNNSSWLVTDRPVKKGEGYEVTLRPLNTNYGVVESTTEFCKPIDPIKRANLVMKHHAYIAKLKSENNA